MVHNAKKRHARRRHRVRRVDNANVDYKLKKCPEAKKEEDTTYLHMLKNGGATCQMGTRAGLHKRQLLRHSVSSIDMPGLGH